jgi:hypothetical protein
MIVPTSNAPLVPAALSRARRGSGFAASAATLVLGLTGGSDEEFLRLRRNWRVTFIGTRILLFAVQLVLPMLIEGFIRRWASGRLGRR